LAFTDIVYMFILSIRRWGCCPCGH